MKAIIITNTEAEVIKLYELCSTLVFNNIGFWGQKQQDYDTMWVWTYDENGLGGCSGYKALESTLDRCLGYENHNVKSLSKKLMSVKH